AAFVKLETMYSFRSVITLISGLYRILFKTNIKIKNCNAKKGNVALKSNNPPVAILELKFPKKILNIRAIVKIGK
ncbi:MAG: hypothetical protein AAFX46_06755, partial [Cyanobacteria bacterium J06636_27]